MAEAGNIDEEKGCVPYLGVHESESSEANVSLNDDVGEIVKDSGE